MSRYNELTVDRLVVGGTVSPVFLTATEEAVTGAGAVSIATYLSTVAGGTGIALTLADGNIDGQIKKVVMISVTSGNTVLTPSNLGNGTAVTFTVIGDTAELIWDGSNWNAIAVYNQATGSNTTPVLA